MKFKYPELPDGIRMDDTIRGIRDAIRKAKLRDEQLGRKGDIGDLVAVVKKDGTISMESRQGVSKEISDLLEMKKMENQPPIPRFKAFQDADGKFKLEPQSSVWFPFLQQQKIKLPSENEPADEAMHSVFVVDLRVAGPPTPAINLIMLASEDIPHNNGLLEPPEYKIGPSSVTLLCRFYSGPPFWRKKNQRKLKSSLRYSGNRKA